MIYRVVRSVALIVCLSASVGCGEATLAKPDAQPAPTDCSQCALNAICDDSGETVVCECEPGYTGDGATCEDIDECAEQNGGCHPEGRCVNSPGSHTCLCPPGHIGDGINCQLLWEQVLSEPNLDLYYGYGINAASANGRIYFAPEVNDPAPYFMSFEPSTGQLYDEAAMPPNTDDFCACGYGGWLVEFQDTLHYFANYGQIYDGSAWIQVNYPFDNQRGEAATAVASSRIFMVGGRGQLREAQYYTGGSQGIWSVPGEVALPPWGIEDAAAAGDGELLYIFGGRTDAGAENKAAVYDARSNAWTELPDIPVNASSPRGAGVFNGKPFVMAGDTIHFFDPASNAWAQTVNAPPNGYFVPVVLDAQLYIVGEQDQDVVIYRLAAFE